MLSSLSPLFTSLGLSFPEKKIVDVIIWPNIRTGAAIVHFNQLQLSKLRDLYHSIYNAACKA